FPIIFGLITFASICCKTITTIAIIIACESPPVINVINILIATAIIAPKYGIILNNPIINPNKIAYFTPIILIAIVVNTTTTTASINWLLINFPNIVLLLSKYFAILLQVLVSNIAAIVFPKKFNIEFLSSNIYIDTIIVTNPSNIPVATPNAPL